MSYGKEGMTHMATADTLGSPAIASDTMGVAGGAIDTLQADTVAAGEEMAGIMLTDPAQPYMPPPERPAAWESGMSWLFLAMSVLFCAICMKFRDSKRYLKALVSDLTDTRLRHNAFDETVKESSLLVLLNVLWVFTGGILVWVAVKEGLAGAGPAAGAPLPSEDTVGAAICTAVVAIYLLVMIAAYWTVGNVFSDRRHTQLWVKGAAASTGLQSMILLPVALLTLLYPEWGHTLLIIAAAVFVVGKIVFLYKGFRIFFAEISSLLLFLYYLCSLEIVPLILTYFGAVWACVWAA